MKHSIFALLLLAFLSVGGIIYGATEIHSAKDQVVLTEKVLYGDKTAAYGLEIQNHGTYRTQLFWDTQFHVGEENKIDTEYSFYPTRRDFDINHTYLGISLNTIIEAGFDMKSEEPQEGLAAAYKELYDSLSPGEEGEKTVYLKDYYDYYPIGGHIDLPGVGLAFNPEGKLYTKDDLEGLDANDQAFVKLQEFFKIPVLETETIVIHAGKSAVNDVAMTMGHSSGEKDNFSFYTESVYTDTLCLFSFDPCSFEGVPIDTSLIPGGYGIYAFPYREGDSPEAIAESMDELSMVYPLDAEAHLLMLSLSPDESKLLIHTAKDNIYHITVVDIATMTKTQEMEVLEWDNGVFLYEEEDFLVLVTGWGEGLSLFTIDENSYYTHRFTVEGTHNQFEEYWYYDQIAMDYDGEKLVIGDHLMMSEYSLRDTCGFYLAVYDETGLLYYGKYENSLNIGQHYEYNACCIPNDGSDPALVIEWK